MKFPQPIPVKEIAKRIGAKKIIGDDSLEATGINEIHKVEPGDINFADVAKYFSKSLHSKATILILNEEAECPEGKVILVVDHPFEAYDSLVRAYRPFSPLSANISETAEIDPSTVIEPNVVVGNHVKIGKNCYLQANCYIGDYTVIGDNVNIQAGSIIGTDAFYYKRTDEKLIKWTSGGRVVIEDNVEIGAGSTVNKGVSGDTVVGEGSKLDSQVHVGHGAVIGKHCLIAAQVGIGGKTIIGDGCVLYGQVGIVQNIVIGDKAIILGQSGVGKSLEGGKTYFGSPVEEVNIKFKQLAALRHLPMFYKNFYQ